MSKTETITACTAGDLRAEVVASAFVDDYGNAEPDVYTWGLAITDPYYCLACGRNFDAWPEAAAHLQATRAGAAS